MSRKNDGLGAHVPSKNLPFPLSANITAVELLTFLPNCLKSAEIVYRLISNYGTRTVIWTIVNTNRDLVKPWQANSCGRTMYKTMREAGFKDWVIGNHKNWHDATISAGEWKQGNINVRGCMTPYERGEGGERAVGVLFEHLATEVRTMPQGADALDLTRLVQYCVEHPQEKWIYPNDYATLLHLLGGPKKVLVEHVDRLAFARWARKEAPPPRLRISPLALVRTQALAAGEMSEEYSDEEHPFDSYTQPPMRWLQPPSTRLESPDDLIAYAFAELGDPSLSDPFDAYAFVRARVCPPFRHLYRIGEPRMTDLSAWAENLRWAKEQRAMFPSKQVMCWDESPAHMEDIDQARAEQGWVSVEWLHSYERHGRVVSELERVLHEEEGSPSISSESLVTYDRGNVGQKQKVGNTDDVNQGVGTVEQRRTDIRSDAAQSVVEAEVSNGGDVPPAIRGLQEVFGDDVQPMVESEKHGQESSSGKEIDQDMDVDSTDTPENRAILRGIGEAVPVFNE